MRIKIFKAVTIASLEAQVNEFLARFEIYQEFSRTHFLIDRGEFVVMLEYIHPDDTEENSEMQWSEVEE